MAGMTPHHLCHSLLVGVPPALREPSVVQREAQAPGSRDGQAGRPLKGCWSHRVYPPLDGLLGAIARLKQNVALQCVENPCWKVRLCSPEDWLTNLWVKKLTSGRW